MTRQYRQSNRVEVRFTDDQMIFLRQVAKKNGEHITDVVRRAVDLHKLAGIL